MSLCFQSGHKKKNCPDTERERYGDYIHEIREGKDSAIDEQHLKAMVAQNRELDTDKKPDVPIEESKDTKNNEAIGGCRPKVPNRCHTLILGDSNMNHIQPPEGFIITSKSGASLLDLPMLIDKANTECPEVLKPHKVVIHLEQMTFHVIKTRRPKL